jgi:hypothetical protein
VSAIRQWDYLGGMVPFTIRGGVSLTSYAVNGTRGGPLPLVNPRGPARKSVLRTALTSRVPDGGRLDSTSCLGSPLSAIHGVQTLSFTLRFADFSGDTTPSLPYRKKKQRWCRCRLVFVGRIRHSRHPAIGAAGRMPDGAHAYPAYAVSVRSCQRHHKKTAIRRNARWRF